MVEAETTFDVIEHAEAPSEVEVSLEGDEAYPRSEVDQAVIAGQSLPTNSIRGTVVVPLHDHAAFIRERLESLLSQWRPDLELLLIDDGSIDAGFAIANALLQDYPHVSVTLVREVKRKGHGLLATMLELGCGSYFIQADSDDIALPGRLDTIAACFDKDPSCRLVTSNALLMSPEGYPISVYEPLSRSEVLSDPVDAAKRQGDTRWLGATAAFHRDLLECFPQIDPELCPYGLDLFAPLRARLLGTHHYIAEPLVGWRQHAGNSHRLLGFVEPADSSAIERRHALGIMVLAQKMRDVAHLDSTLGGRPDLDLYHVAYVAQDTFKVAFDEWCRSRQSSRLLPPLTTSRPFVPEAPPVVTLRANETQRLAAYSRMGAVLARWSGFSELEAWGIWSHRVALFVLRLPEDVRILRLEFFMHPWCERQHVSIRVGDARWERDDLASGASVIADIALCAPRALNQPIVIVAHDASAPGPIDTRSLGIALTSLSAF